MDRAYENLEKRLKVWIEDFSSCLKEFLKYKKKILLGAIILAAASIGTSAYAILEGLNYHLPVLQVVMTRFILYFLLYFTPTPRGTGVAEGGYYTLNGLKLNFSIEFRIQESGER